MSRDTQEKTPLGNANGVNEEATATTVNNNIAGDRENANVLAQIFDGANTSEGVSDEYADLATEALRINDIEQRRDFMRNALQNDAKGLAALSGSSPEQPQREYTQTDTGNARRLVDMAGRDLRFVTEAKCWYRWAGTHWQPDNENYVLGLTSQVSDAIRAECFELSAQSEEEQKRQEQLLKWANKSLEERRRGAMLNLAAAEPGMTLTVDKFDRSPWLVNCKNGTIDLRTGELRQHRRDDFITHVLPLKYDPQATCPRWEQFLNEVFKGDAELIDFIHRAVGYSLTGDISEQVFFILYGIGANGKSTFLNTLRAALGPLALHTNIEAFTARDTGRIPEDRARLRGARFATTSETAKGHRLDESFVKDATGGEPITARFLHQNSFEFNPEFKLWLACNHKPQINGTDEGIWRRVRLVPFTARFENSERDPNLAYKLTQELPGVLRWAVDGCREWQDKGLGMPNAVERATNEYRNEQDVVGIFLEECCEQSRELSVSSSELYQAYKSWAEHGGFGVLNQRNFGLAVKERGFESSRGSGGKKVYRGLTLIHSE